MCEFQIVSGSIGIDQGNGLGGRRIRNQIASLAKVGLRRGT